MPGLFDITPPSTFVALHRQWQGTVAFSVRLLAKRSIHATAKIVTIPPDSRAAKWLTLLPPKGEADIEANVREFHAKESQEYLIKVALPDDAEFGTYDFKLVVADQINPEAIFVESPAITFAVIEPKKRRLRTYVIAAVLLLILLMIAFVIFSVIVASTTPEGIIILGCR